MKSVSNVIVAADGGIIVLVFIILVIMAVIKGASKPKGEWVYVEQKKGCLVLLVLALLFVSFSIGKVIAFCN